MGKKSRRRLSRFEKNETGCMWGLVRMLHFGHVHSSQNHFSDWKQGSKHVIGAVSKREKREDSCETVEDGKCDMDSEAAKGHAARMSVKELMKEEMIGEQNQKRRASNADDQSNQTESTNGVCSKKTHRMKKKSFDLGDTDASVSRAVAHQKHKPSKSLDLRLVMEELYSQIPMKTGDHSEQRSEREAASQPRQDSSVIEQGLGEVTKVSIHHFYDEKDYKKDRKTQTSKELMDALHVLNRNEETFLKLLQDPDSQLLLNLQKLQDSHLMKDENSHHSLEQVLEKDKQDGFLRGKFKGPERSLSNRNDGSEDLSRIVILKPGPASSYNSGTTSTSDNGQIHKCSSNFSFSEFKRKLKLAARKELPDCRVVDKAMGGENDGTPSPRNPRKDHLFIEKVPKSVSSLNKVDSMGKSVESGLGVELGTSYKVEQRVSNIYFEARKHIAEIVGSSDEDLDSLGKQVTKSLGKILSLPQCNSPTCSPRLGRDRGLPSIQRIHPPCHESYHTEENNACHQAPVKTMDLQESAIQPTEGQDSVDQGTEVESCISEEKVEDEAHEPDGIFLSRDEESEVVEVLSSSDTEIEQNSSKLDISFPECSSISTTDAEVVDSLHCADERGQSTSLESDDALGASFSSASQSGSSPTKEVKHLDSTKDRVQHMSAVSVLDPTYTKDDVSPSCRKSLLVSAMKPKQPQKIQFQEPMLSLAGRFSCADAYGEDKRSMFEFIKVAVEKSGLTWDELQRRSLLLDRILDPLLLDELEFLQDRLCDDPKLIFDLIEESLAEACLQRFGPTLPFSRLSNFPELKGEDILAGTWEGVNWHFQLEQLPRTLQQVVATDYVKEREWMDLRPDTERIGFDMEAAILEGLVKDTILDYVISSEKHDSLLRSLESRGNE